MNKNLIIFLVFSAESYIVVHCTNLSKNFTYTFYITVVCVRLSGFFFFFLWVCGVGQQSGVGKWVGEEWKKNLGKGEN